jgi:HlyD family secretion protein
MNRRWYVYLLTLFSVAMLTVAMWHVVIAERPLADLAPPANPPRSAFSASIAGVGLIEAESENISIGSPLSGVVIEMPVSPEEVGKRVHRGEVLFRIDDRRLRAELASKEAQVAAAKSQLDRLKAMPRKESVPASEAKVRAVRALADRALDDYQRAELIFRRGANTEQDVITKRLSYQAALHDVAIAQADDALLKAGAWEADMAVASANIATAEADAKLARTELDRATVRSPIEGHVLQVKLRLGEYVTAVATSEPLMVVGNKDRLHLRVDIDEADIPRFRPEAAAVGRLRGAPQSKLPLKFVRVEPLVTIKKSLTGENTERIDTRVLQVIYEIQPSDATLYVGQQVDVFIESR